MCVGFSNTDKTDKTDKTYKHPASSYLFKHTERKNDRIPK